MAGKKAPAQRQSRSRDPTQQPEAESRSTCITAGSTVHAGEVSTAKGRSARRASSSGRFFTATADLRGQAWGRITYEVGC